MISTKIIKTTTMIMHCSAQVSGDIKHMSISDDFLSKQAQAPRLANTILIITIT